MMQLDKEAGQWVEREVKENVKKEDFIEHKMEVWYIPAGEMQVVQILQMV